MNESRYTPGPWIVGKKNSQFDGYVSISSQNLNAQDAHSGLAKVVWQMSDDAEDGQPSPSCEANARLIAAAPELLEALQSAYDRITDLLAGDDGQAYKEAEKALPKLRAAIAKALWEQP